jgi:hypothetical protein
MASQRIFPYFPILGKRYDVTASVLLSRVDCSGTTTRPLILGDKLGHHNARIGRVLIPDVEVHVVVRRQHLVAPLLEHRLAGAGVAVLAQVPPTALAGLPVAHLLGGGRRRTPPTRSDSDT